MESAVDFTGSTVRFLLVALLLHFSVCWCCMTTRFPTCDSQARTANLCELVTGRPRTTEGAHLRQAVSRRLLALSTSGRARCTGLPCVVWSRLLLRPPTNELLSVQHYHIGPLRATCQIGARLFAAFSSVCIRPLRLVDLFPPVLPLLSPLARP
ncbi:hypothetical protein OF846_003040 [Rhodotorula toruloides]|nr:hypothetical protein OF846_003040 [Rhodotorula toruloides]